jgi:hypothetical protein
MTIGRCPCCGSLCSLVPVYSWDQELGTRIVVAQAVSCESVTCCLNMPDYQDDTAKLVERWNRRVNMNGNQTWLIRVRPSGEVFQVVPLQPAGEDMDKLIEVELKRLHPEPDYPWDQVDWDAERYQELYPSACHLLFQGKL